MSPVLVKIVGISGDIGIKRQKKVSNGKYQTKNEDDGWSNCL